MVNLLSGIDKCRTVSSENDDSLVEICNEGIVQGDKKKRQIMKLPVPNLGVQSLLVKEEKATRYLLAWLTRNKNFVY